MSERSEQYILYLGDNEKCYVCEWGVWVHHVGERFYWACSVVQVLPSKLITYHNFTFQENPDRCSIYLKLNESYFTNIKEKKNLKSKALGDYHLIFYVSYEW